MIVCIAEKPSVARDIAEVLGARNKKEGYIEGNGYQVTWTFGHLCTLKEPHEYTPSWKSWNMGALPMIPPRFGIRLIADKGIEKQFSIIEKLMSKAEGIINCGDAGQEGELIQRWVMQKAGAHCPVKRLWISSLTEEAIRQGFSQLRDQSEFQALYEAGLSRAIGDWLLGMNATRLYTLKYGRKGQVLSIGRVQTPTLALIVKRQQEIECFKPEPYWELKTVYREVTFSTAKGRFSKEEEAQQLLEKIKTAPFIVKDITAKKGTEAPPRLFDLTSLQVECNKKYGYGADLTLQLIQSLYEKKATTYPRVDTTYLSEDIYPKCASILSGLKKYAVYTAPLANTKLLKRKKVFDNSKVTDHHAIIPTGKEVTGLTDMEMRVFNLIVQRFIAIFYPDCQFMATTVLGTAADVDFKVSGKQITEPGWRMLFTKEVQEENKENDEEKVLPHFVPGESGPHMPSLAQKYTQPPKPYTEATLLRTMETAGKTVDNDELRDALKENGIGRPSTRAAIIETLFKRKYIAKERKNLKATPTGIELIGLIHEDLLKSAELTGIWEKKLREIERGKYDAGGFLTELKQMVTDIVYSVMKDNTNRRITQVAEPEPVKTTRKARNPKKEADKNTAPKKKTAATKIPDVKEGDKCPLCGKGIVIRGKTALGCSEWKNGCSFRKTL